jgi:hypothetical protein
MSLHLQSLSVMRVKSSRKAETFNQTRLPLLYIFCQCLLPPQRLMRAVALCIRPTLRWPGELMFATRHAALYRVMEFECMNTTQDALCDLHGRHDLKA